MPKSIKIIIILLTGTIITLGAGAGFIMLTFNHDDYRKALTDLVYQTSDYQLEIVEPFTAEFSLRPTFSAAAIKLIGPDNQKPIKIQKLKLKLILEALLHGKFRLEVAGIIKNKNSLEQLLPKELSRIRVIKFKTRLATDGSELKLTDLEIEADDGQKLKLKVQGMALIEDFETDQLVSRLDLKFALSSPDTAAISQIIGQPLPELGPIELKTRIRGGGREFSFSDLKLHTGSKKALSSETDGGLNLVISPAAKAGGNPNFKLEKIDLRLSVSAPAGSRLPLSPKASDPGFKVPDSGPLAIDLKLSGNQKKIKLSKFSTSFGKTSVTAELEARLTGKRPYLNGKITAPMIAFDEFAALAPAKTEAPVAKSQKQLSDKKTDNPDKDRDLLLSRQPFPRNWLHQLDCEIEFKAGRITGLQKGLKDLQLAIKLENGRLDLDPASFVFEDGHAEFSLSVNDRNTATTPEVELKAEVDDFDLNHGLMALLDSDSHISGKLTANTKLKSRGISPHELAANLDGPFEVVLEAGEIPSQYMKLLAVDFLGWSFDQVLMQNRSTEISCGILALDTKKGLLTCRAFILESPNMIVTGAGTVNLDTEICDLTLYPKKKRKFWATVSPVNIRGPLQDPRVITIPFKSAALLYGGALLAPQFFLPAIGLNYLWDKVSKDTDGPQSPCFEYLHKKP